MDDHTGEIEISKLSYIFSKENPAAVFCTHVSNVTGYILPVDEIFAETMKETLKMEVLLEEYLKKQDEKSKSERYVPKKIGDERKKKIKNVRGKRYGR